MLQMASTYFLQAIDWMSKLKEFKIHWIEEPTCADDVLGHKAISEVSIKIIWEWILIFDLLQSVREAGTGVATGEACQNRVMFKQFLMSGAMQFCQVTTACVKWKIVSGCIPWIVRPPHLVQP